MTDFLKANWVALLAIVVAVETQFGNGTMSLANMMPADWIPFAKAWMANLGTIGGLIVAYGSRQQTLNVPPAVKAVIIAGLALTGLLTFGGSEALAQTRAPQVIHPAADAQPAQEPPCLFPIDPLHLCGKLPNANNPNSEENMKAVVARLKAVVSDDLNYALAKANAANTNTSKVRAQCVQGIINARNQFNGDLRGPDVKNPDGSVTPGPIIPHPDPAFVTTVEEVAELADNLSPQGALLTSCVGAAGMFKLTALQVVNAFITGAISIAALPAGL